MTTSEEQPIRVEIHREDISIKFLAFPQPGKVDEVKSGLDDYEKQLDTYLSCDSNGKKNCAAYLANSLSAVRENCEINKFTISITAQNCDLHSFPVHHQSIHDSFFVGCSLLDATFSGSSFTKTSFEWCQLQNTSFRHARFISTTTIKSCEVNRQTLFTDMPHPYGLSLDRATFQQLGPTRGGMNDYQLAGINLIDDAAMLRSQFSSVNRFMYAAAIMIFVAPYFVFAGRLWIYSFAAEGGGKSIPVITAMLRYVWNGGEGWRTGWQFDPQTFGIFIYMCILHALRVVLAKKSAALDARLEIFGLPPYLDFKNAIFLPSQLKWLTWGIIYYTMVWGARLAWGLVLYNAYRFMTMRVPIPDSM